MCEMRVGAVVFVGLREGYSWMLEVDNFSMDDTILVEW
jgi:hypothetical protein